MASLRNFFPFIQNNPGVVYFDSAATSLKPQSAIDALLHYHTHESVNIHRGVYKLSQHATDTVESVRQKVTRFVTDEKDGTSVFVRGTTEGLNLLAHSLTSPKSHLKDFFAAYQSDKKPAILISESEHHANIVPWQIAAERMGYALLYVPIDSEGNFNYPVDFLSRIEASYSLRIVSLSLQSNVTGIVHDLAPFREAAKRIGAVFIVDAAQGILHAPQTLRELQPDFTVFSGHKLFSATGIGAVVGSKRVLDSLDVWQGGGGMINLVEKDHSTYLEAPTRFEAGTQAVGEIFSLGKAIEFADEYAREIHAHDREITAYADAAFEKAGIRFFGKGAKTRSAIYSFEIPGVHPHDIGTLLDEQMICIRAGHHCCQILMRALGVSATARASMSVYNTQDEVDKLLEGIQHVKKIFRK